MNGRRSAFCSRKPSATGSGRQLIGLPSFAWNNNHRILGSIALAQHAHAAVTEGRFELFAGFGDQAGQRCCLLDFEIFRFRPDDGAVRS